MAIKVINAGLFTTVQDQGRWGYQAYGVPVAGVMDRYAANIANILAGNDEAKAVLEMTFKGGSFSFSREAYIAITGAEMGATLNGVKICNWQGIKVQAGSILEFSYAQSGARTYLAINGGIDIPEVLGSRSTYTRGALGGVDGRQLKIDDELKIGTSDSCPSENIILNEEFIPNYANEIVLRVLLGPQDSAFTSTGIATLFSKAYTITADSDRMGYRLEGPKIQHKDKADIVSDALALGSIQVPGHGMPIIMMADRQTTGGYTKIGTVISSDLAKLAQAKPGDTISFAQVNYDEAITSLKDEQKVYDQIRNKTFCQPKVQAKLKRYIVKVNGVTYNVEVEEDGTCVLI